MPTIKRGEVWLVDFGMSAKVWPALLLTGHPADDELDLVTLLLHTTSLRGNRWELRLPKAFLKDGAFHLQQIQTVPRLKLLKWLGNLTPEEMEQVSAGTTASLRNVYAGLLSSIWLLKQLNS